MSNTDNTVSVERKKLGLAQLFSELHPLLSPMNEMNAEETVELLCMQNRRTRKKFADTLNEGVSSILNDRTIDVNDYINDDIRELAKYPVSAYGFSRLTPIFEWIQTLHRENAFAIERSRYSVNDAASHMDRATGDFVRSCFSNLMWHGVSFVREGDTVTLNLRERLWGKAGIVFPNVRTKFTGTFPMVGIFFWMDAAYSDGRYSFTFMIDVEFGDEDLDRRTVQDRNWVRFSFECDCPYMIFEGFDYGKYLSDFGYCGHRFIDNWCGEVLNKEAMLGEKSMSQKELELLPVAKIMLIAYQLADIDSGREIKRQVEGNLSQKVLEELDNRYGFKNMKALLKDSQQEQLWDMLEKAIEAWSGSEDFGETNKHIWGFARLLREKEREDGVRLLYQNMVKLMRDCTSEFDGVSKIYGTYPQAQEKMRDIIEPKLLSEGFTGQYPHYRRRRGNKGEYISVNTYDMNNRTINGVMTYFFSLSSAVKRLEKRGKRKSAEYFAGGLPFDATTADDCFSVFSKDTKYTELGGIYDGERASISVDVFKGIPDDEGTPDTAQVLGSFADVAFASMKGRKMPRWYKKKRRKSAVKLTPETTIDDMIVKYLPFGIYLSILLMGTYAVCDRFFTVTDYISVLTGGVAVVISLLAGLIFTLVCSAAKMHSLKKQIWRY